jgi:hypothetical protein
MKAAAEKLLEAQEQAGQKILENVEKEAAAKLDIVLSSFFDMVNDRLIVAEKGYDKNREAALYYQAKRYFFRGITVGLISFCVGMIAGGPIMEVFFTVIKNALAWL